MAPWAWGPGAPVHLPALAGGLHLRGQWVRYGDRRGELGLGPRAPTHNLSGIHRQPKAKKPTFKAETTIFPCRKTDLTHGVGEGRSALQLCADRQLR